MPETKITPESSGLAALESRVLHDLELTEYPKRAWSMPRKAKNGDPVYDVLIVGAGQGGLSVAFGLLREKVANILVVDENPEGLEGPWKTFARMKTLRTPKYLTGPDWGIPNLTFRAWYEARFGAGAWDEVRLIPKELWADYLIWYRKFLKIPVRNECRAGAVEWDEAEGHFLIPIEHKGKSETLRARKVVLATGIDGSGKWEIPEAIKNSLDKASYAHTHDSIDFEALVGKRIGILGAGASAFDNASVALETGAREVRLFFRRKKLVDINPYRWAEFTGFLKHHSDLPDDMRWKFILQILRMGQLPPADTFARAKSHPGFSLHPDSTWDRVEKKGDAVVVHTARESFEFDFLIIGTGFVTDLGLRPELAKIAPKIALWKDRYVPPKEDSHEDLSRHPYLGPSFEYQEKTPGEAPYLASIFNYTFGGLASLGFGGASISGLKYSLPKVVGGITRQLFLEDGEQFFRTLQDYNDKEF